MKKLIFLFTAIFLLQSIAFSQDIKSDNLQDFKKVSLSGKLNVTLEKSDHNSIEIKLINSDLSKIDWSIKDNTLSIRLKVSTQRESSANVVIYYKDITTIDVKGATAKFNGAIKAGLFTANISSGANLMFEIYASDLTVRAEGNSHTNIKGGVSYMTIRANSKAKVDARELEAKSIIATTLFGAEIFVWGSEKLDAKASSSSVIYYKGTPEILKIEEKLLGTVEQFSL